MTPARLLLLLAAIAAVALVEVRAAPLDAESCSNLEVERALLRLAGVEADMEKGPDWAKANLTPQRVQEIGRLIEVEGQLLFRCRATTAARDDDDNDKEGKAPPATKKPAATKGPAAKAKKPARKAAAKPAPASGSKKKDSGTAKAKPAPRKQPARKSGDDD